MHGQHTHAAERGQCARSNGAGLHDERDSEPHEDGHVVVHVRRAHDDLLG